MAMLLTTILCALAPTVPAAPLQETSGAWVRRGREHLAEGRATEAADAFRNALEIEDDPLAEAWLIRARIELGEIEPAFEQIEALAGAGNPWTAYLFGMAFRALALREAAEGGTSTTSMVFTDAVSWLSEAAESDPTTFPDVHYALAESAWYAQDLSRARRAIEDALIYGQNGARERTLHGRIALSQYKVASSDGLEEEAQAHLEAARRAFEAALDASGVLSSHARAESSEEAALAAERWTQLAYVHVYREDLESAARAFAEAAAWSPESVDFNYVREVLDSGLFLQNMRVARRLYKKRHESHEKGDALISWWLGYAQYALNTRADRALAESNFLEAVTRNEEFVASWYYIARARSTQQNHAGTFEALMQYRARDEAGLIASLESDLERNVWMLESLVAWCAGGRDDGGRPDNEGAVKVCELIVALQPNVARHWNNLGLFNRDAGDALLSKRGDDRRERRQAYWEAAYEAYSRALELDPKNPIYLNDTAVVLHYNLQRDLDRALAMYEEALRLAEAALAEGSLSHDERRAYETVVRDAGDNLLKLSALLDRKAREASAER